MITETLTTFSSLLKGDRRLLAGSSVRWPARHPAIPDGFEVPERPTAWGPEVLAQIEWRRFDALMEALFQQAGLMTRSRSLGGGQGVDIWLYSRHQSGQPVSLARCRQHLPNQALTTADVAELKSALAAQGVSHGQWVVGSVVAMAPEARSAARLARVQCMDEAGLRAVIQARPPAQQAELLAVALQGDYWRPTCPSCGFKMAAAANVRATSPVWVCGSRHGCQTAWPDGALLSEAPR